MRRMILGLSCFVLGFVLVLAVVLQCYGQTAYEGPVDPETLHTWQRVGDVYSSDSAMMVFMKNTDPKSKVTHASCLIDYLGRLFAYVLHIDGALHFYVLDPQTGKFIADTASQESLKTYNKVARLMNEECGLKIPFRTGGC